jgi:hypothetical protein
MDGAHKPTAFELRVAGRLLAAAVPLVVNE